MKQPVGEKNIDDKIHRNKSPILNDMKWVKEPKQKELFLAIVF